MKQSASAFHVSIFQEKTILSFHHEMSTTINSLNFLVLGSRADSYSRLRLLTLLAKVIKFLVGKPFTKSFVCKVFVFATIYLLKVYCFTTCLVN